MTIGQTIVFILAIAGALLCFGRLLYLLIEPREYEDCTIVGKEKRNQ